MGSKQSIVDQKTIFGAKKIIKRNSPGQGRQYTKVFFRYVKNESFVLRICYNYFNIGIRNWTITQKFLVFLGMCKMNNSFWKFATPIPILGYFRTMYGKAH